MSSLTSNQCEIGPGITLSTNRPLILNVSTPHDISINSSLSHNLDMVDTSAPNPLLFSFNAGESVAQVDRSVVTAGNEVSTV